MIELRDIVTAHALRGLSFSISTGENVVVCGPSGAGKTTMLRVVAGLESIIAGSVLINGEIATLAFDVPMAPHQRGIGMVFQDLGLWPHLSVGANIACALPGGLKAVMRRSRVDEMLQRCALPGFAKRSVGSLSGGELSRVALARAMISQPRILLLDEPFSGLDVLLKEELAAVIESLLKEQPTTTISVVHDVSDAVLLGTSRVICIANGCGTDDMLFAEPAELSSRSPFLRKWMHSLEVRPPAHGKHAV